MGLRYVAAHAGILTLVVDAYHKVSQRIHNEPRQDGIVLSGVSAEFPLYAHADIAARHRRWQESLPVTPAFGLADREIVNAKLLLGGNAEVDSPVKAPESPCWWSSSLSDWTCAAPGIFGWAHFDAKDVEGVSREEYRRPLALFDYVEGTEQPDCPVPYRDKKWTALTYCFGSQAEVDRWINLKKSSVRFNNALALSGAQSMEPSPFQEQKAVIVRNSGSEYRTIIDPETAELIKKLQIKDKLEVYMRHHPLGQIPKYFEEREANAVDARSERKAVVEAKKAGKKIEREIWLEHDEKAADYEASFNPKVVQHRHPPKWKVEESRYVPVTPTTNERDTGRGKGKRKRSDDHAAEETAVDIVAAPVELVERLVDELMLAAEDGPRSDRFAIDPYFLVAARKQ